MPRYEGASSGLMPGVAVDASRLPDRSVSPATRLTYGLRIRTP